jgi:ATP-binding cassette subfamily G (WHITE) protein 2 (SNQ2)
MRGTITPFVQDSVQSADGDSEKALQASHMSVADEKPRSEIDSKATKPPVAQQNINMADIFTWQNIKYVVPVSGGEHRQLLDDVSGYVSPGKLTALMGESGAGKVNVLANSSNSLFLI